MPKKKSYKQIMQDIIKPKTSKVKPAESIKENVGSGNFKKLEKI